MSPLPVLTVLSKLRNFMPEMQQANQQLEQQMQVRTSPMSHDSTGTEAMHRCYNFLAHGYERIANCRCTEHWDHQGITYSALTSMLPAAMPQTYGHTAWRYTNGSSVTPYHDMLMTG